MGEEKGLVVTTLHRGVFFGYGIPTDSKTITLKRCRMCIYWPVENHGVVGLASDGPKPGARITPAAPDVILQDVTSVMIASDTAVKVWERELWN